jgi:hypothetical protein
MILLNAKKGGPETVKGEFRVRATAMYSLIGSAEQPLIQLSEFAEALLRTGPMWLNCGSFFYYFRRLKVKSL